MWENMTRNVAFVNSLTATAISIVANISVIIFFAANRKSRFKDHNYIYTIIYITFVNIIYSINQVFAAPIIHIHHDELIFVNNGLLQHKVLGQISLCVFAFFVVYVVIFSSAQFVIKYLLMCRSNNKISITTIFKIHLIAFLLASAWSLLIAWSLIDFDGSEHEEDEEYEEYEEQEHEFRDRPSLNSHIRENSKLLAAISLLFFLILISFFVIMFCSREITLTLRRLCSSDKTRCLQIRMYKMLVTETILPLIFIHLPLITSCALPLVHLHVDMVLHYLPLLYAWYPALDPLVVLWNLKINRNETKRIFNKTTPLGPFGIASFR